MQTCRSVNLNLAYQVNLVNLLIELPCASYIGNTYKMGMQLQTKRVLQIYGEKRGRKSHRTLCKGQEVPQDITDPKRGQEVPRHLPRNCRNNSPRNLPSYTICRTTLPYQLRSSVNDILKLCCVCLRSEYDVCVLPANAAPISDARVSQSLIRTLPPERGIPLIKLFVQ